MLLKEAQKQENSEKCSATSQLHDARQQADQLYLQHIKMARLAIPQDRKHWLNLDLHGPRKKDITGWLYQTRAFYTHTEPVAELLAQHGISPEELLQAKAMIEAVAAARVEQNEGISNTQQAKEQRDLTLEELREWMKKFMKTVRFAFDDNKQQLEALGIVVAS